MEMRNCHLWSLLAAVVALREAIINNLSFKKLIMDCYALKKKFLFTLLSAAFDNVGKQFVFISCVVVQQTSGLGRMQGCWQKVLLPSGICSVHLRLWLLLFAS